MLKNYFNVALRNIIRHKGYSFINIAGLAIGIAVCILILLWAQFQFSYDKFHENIDDLYWVGTYYHLGNDVGKNYGSPPAVGPALKSDYPDIIKSTRYMRHGGLIKYCDNHFRERIKMVDPDFLEMFTFPLVKGDSQTALSDPYSVVVSEKIAQKYFGDENPMGKTLVLDNKHNFTVTGVAQGYPDNSTFGFDFLMPIACVNDLIRENYTDTWYNCAFYNFVQLRDGVDYQTVSEQIFERIRQSDPDTNLESFLFPMSKIHLHWIGGTGGYIDTVKMFAQIGFLILLIAVINFVNLMTARSGKRTKEVGLRKVVGAHRAELIRQFYFESIFHAFLACFIAVGLVELLLPVFNSVTGESVAFDLIKYPIIPLGIIGIALITGLISGSYPALLLSAYQPVKALKGSISIGAKKSWFRRILVVFQFAASIILIICTTVIYNQHHFMKNKDIGFNKDNVIYLPMSTNLQENFDVIKSELLSHPNIQYVTRSTHSLSGIYWNGEGWLWEGKDENIDPLVTYLGVGYDFLETFGIEMADGNFYSQELDGTISDGIVINQSFANILSFETSIGQSLTKGDDNYIVFGVVKDFHYKPVYQKVGPLVMFFEPDHNNWYLFTRIHSENVSETIDYIQGIWSEFNPDLPFEYHFLDEDYESFYYGEKATGDILRYFAILAILISCLGLFGLAAFAAEQRTKEIGIRKVLGATVTGIVRLLSKEFLILVVVANILACPIAFYLMSQWLQRYVYRTNLGWYIFFQTAMIAIAIAVMSISFQAIKAAVANPVDSLRYE